MYVEPLPGAFGVSKLIYFTLGDARRWCYSRRDDLLIRQELLAVLRKRSKHDSLSLRNFFRKKLSWFSFHVYTPFGISRVKNVTKQIISTEEQTKASLVPCKRFKNLRNVNWANDNLFTLTSGWYLKTRRNLRFYFTMKFLKYMQGWIHLLLKERYSFRKFQTHHSVLERKVWL